MMQTLSVALHDHQYPIYIGPNLLSDSALFRRHLAGRQVFIVSNALVADLYLKRMLENFADLTVDHLLLPDGEQYKTLSVVSEIFDTLLERGHHRSTTVIALGGGVIGDMTGFAAACYQRGVAFIQAPTTLLAQVDSSVGGKTGVNHPLGKNMIGAFYQPQAVIIDTHTLATLDDRQYSAGLAEVFKYGLLADSEFFRWCEDHIDALMARDLATIEQAILRSCRIKAQIVAADEREQGCRALLNLGHTFGHALESITQYKIFLHGEAVAVGLVLAAQLSQALNFISEQEVQRIKTLLKMAALPTCLPDTADARQMLDHMYRDKKVIDGRLRLIVLAKLGQAQIFDQAEEAMIQSVLQDNTA